MIEMKVFFWQESCKPHVSASKSVSGSCHLWFTMPVSDPNSKAAKICFGFRNFTKAYYNTVTHFRKNTAVCAVLCENYRTFLGLNLKIVLCQNSLKVKKSLVWEEDNARTYWNLPIYLWHVFNGIVKHMKLVTNFIFFAANLSSWIKRGPFSLNCKL